MEAYWGHFVLVLALAQARLSLCCSKMRFVSKSHADAVITAKSL